MIRCTYQIIDTAYGIRDPHATPSVPPRSPSTKTENTADPSVRSSRTGYRIATIANWELGPLEVGCHIHATCHMPLKFWYIPVIFGYHMIFHHNMILLDII
jgi:hypothetical protein